MPALGFPLRAHHFAEIGVPLFELLLRFARELELGEVVFAQPVEIAAIGPDDVLHLPHVEEIFRAIIFSEGVSLDKYLGEDYPLYSKYYSKSQRAAMCMSFSC